jgi:hypothetical protein
MTNRALRPGQSFEFEHAVCAESCNPDLLDLVQLGKSIGTFSLEKYGFASFKLRCSGDLR